MNEASDLTQLTKKRRVAAYLIYLFILGFLFAAGAEVVLRSSDFMPWQVHDVSIRVDPGGKFFRRHPSLGYSHIPGRFTVTYQSDYSFNVTHLSNSLRITRPLESYSEPVQTEEIWIFGCSFTHGWLINDEETFPWLLQERLPDYDVINFGVSGYGTLHSLLQFRESLKAKVPKVVILAYADFHDERNTFSRSRRKQVAPYSKLGPLEQPYARIDKEGGLRYFRANVDYSELPMMKYSALAHFIEKAYNYLERIWLRSHAVSESLVSEMARLAETHEVKFVVANVKEGQSMLNFAERNGIPNIDISVDLELPENLARPDDGHPSASANRQYADKLEKFLREFFFEPDTPTP